MQMSAGWWTQPSPAAASSSPAKRTMAPEWRFGLEPGEWQASERATPFELAQTPT